MTTLKLKPLHPFSAEASGIDISRPLDAAGIRAIEDAMDRHAVLVFRNQPLTQDQQIAFAKSFGPLDLGLRKLKGGPHRFQYAELADISNVKADGEVDDTNLAYLCDEKMREAARQRGDDPNELPHRYAAFINKVVAQKPAGMLLAMHLCRGNFKSTHAASGNYEPVAEALLKEMNLDAYFMEYDDARSGDFKPLRYLPKGKTVVLGLITTKFGAMEDKDDIKRRIEEAAKYAPLDQLALSPQCGFSSTVHGNDIAVEAQRAKLRLVIETAQEVWGST